MRKDPTDVVGLRVAAYAIDAVVLTVLLFIGFSVTSSATTADGNVCDAEVVDDGQGGEMAVEWTASEMCIYMQNDTTDESTVIEYSLAGMAVLPALYAVGAIWILQGITGGSPGKLACGLRVVDREGKVCGVGRSVLRSVLWIVDGLPGLCVCFFTPLVGFIAMLVSKEHRRIGDLAAGTYVVRKDSVGQGISGPHHQAYGGSPWGGPAGDPARPPAAAPDGQGQPQWDEARRSWIQYSPGRATWLQHDPVTGDWRPIS